MVGDEWGRVFRGTPPAATTNTITDFTVHYTGTSQVNAKREDVARYVKNIEQSQFNRDPRMSAIGYNYLIDKYGRIIEGRGWEYRNASNGGSANNTTSYSVCVLVGVNDNKPTDSILLALRRLYKFLCTITGRQLKVQGHRDVRATACPGAELYTLVQSGRIEKKGNVVRISGANRYSTSAAVSKAAFPNGADEVFVVSGMGFPDALSAGPLAAGRGPLLLTDPKKLPPSTVEEIKRLKPKKITVVGGPTAVSDSVVAELEMLLI